MTYKIDDAESIVLLVFVLWRCLNLGWIRGSGVRLLFRASWNRIFFQPVFLTFKSNLIETRNTALTFSNKILLHINWSAVVLRCSSKLGVLKNFANFTGKHQHRCFPVKLAKFSRTPFLKSSLKSSSGGCSCTYCKHMTSHAIWVDEITDKMVTIKKVKKS